MPKHYTGCNIVTVSLAKEHVVLCITAKLSTSYIMSRMHECIGMSIASQAGVL